MTERCITCGRLKDDPLECVNWLRQEQELEAIKKKLTIDDLPALRKIVNDPRRFTFKVEA